MEKFRKRMEQTRKDFGKLWKIFEKKEAPDRVLLYIFVGVDAYIAPMQ